MQATWCLPRGGYFCWQVGLSRIVPEKNRPSVAGKPAVRTRVLDSTNPCPSIGGAAELNLPLYAPHVAVLGRLPAAGHHAVAALARHDRGRGHKIIVLAAGGVPPAPPATPMAMTLGEQVGDTVGSPVASVINIAGDRIEVVNRRRVHAPCVLRRSRARRRLGAPVRRDSTTARPTPISAWSLARGRADRAREDISVVMSSTLDVRHRHAAGHAP